MSLNFTIDNIISTYFIEKNKKHSFAVYYNKNFNLFYFVKQFIYKISKILVISNIPLLHLFR